MHLRLPGPPDEHVVTVDAPRPLPVDWHRWVVAVVGEPILQPPRETFTLGGWSLTLVVAGARVHAFYAFFEQVVHAVAALPDPDHLPGLVDVFLRGEPVWDGTPIVALAEL